MPSRSSLSLRQQVGQLMIMGFDGAEFSLRLRTMLATFQPGGVILFKRNIAEITQTQSLLRGIEKATTIPLFRCVDMEGGTVDRFRDVVAPIPSAYDVARTGLAKLFRRHGELIGEELRALGFNTDFAPCLDLRLPESAGVMGPRTISSDPYEVVRYAREFLNGLGDSRVLSCAKHFPGLGGANLDSHHVLPSIARTWKQVWDHDVVPYRELRRYFPFVMVAHVSYPRITRDNSPASLSKKWITGVLREKIGHKGLVISDDLDMGGTRNIVPIEEAAVKTLRAGSDMFLVCQKEENVWRAFEAVLQRAERDKSFAASIASKAKRVVAFKARSAEMRTRFAPLPTQSKVEALRRRVWEFSEEVRLSTPVMDTATTATVETIGELAR
jgi:beta-N-acetylhexosaminidase